MAEEIAVAPVPPTTPSNETLIQLVRVGTFYDEKNKPYHLFQRVVDGELREQLSFSITKHNRRLDGRGLQADRAAFALGLAGTWAAGGGFGELEAFEGVLNAELVGRGLRLRILGFLAITENGLQHVGSLNVWK
mgnify:CR=1 FL=1